MVVASPPGVVALTRAEDNLEIQTTVLHDIAARLHAAREAGTAKYQTTAAWYFKQTQIVEEAQEQVERLRAQADLTTHWRERTDRIRIGLEDEYAGRGMQYTILIERLVSAVVRVEQLEASGRVVDTAEWRAASRTVMELTAQLQRYTESTKSEAMQTIKHQAMVVVIEVCERVIAPRQPELWKTILGEIERQLPSGA